MVVVRAIALIFQLICSFIFLSFGFVIYNHATSPWGNPANEWLGWFLIITGLASILVGIYREFD